MSLRVRADTQNPGHVFACCGLLELSSRFAPEAAAWFAGGWFQIDGGLELAELIERWSSIELAADPDPGDDADESAPPMRVPEPFGLRLDWWQDRLGGGADLKIWAGSMQCVRIAKAMTSALRGEAYRGEDLLDVGQVVMDPSEPTKKVEPFYFDARRAPNAHARDVGFAPNDLDLTTTAFPAVESLCMVGLQRFRPAPMPKQRRNFVYTIWGVPLTATLVAPVLAGVVPMPGARRFRFETWFRTGQRKHKAFRAAVPVVEGG